MSTRRLSNGSYVISGQRTPAGKHREGNRDEREEHRATRSCLVKVRPHGIVRGYQLGEHQKKLTAICPHENSQREWSGRTSINALRAIRYLDPKTLRQHSVGTVVIIRQLYEIGR